jgi:uncharacterized protein (TIGR03067 family)
MPTDPTRVKAIFLEAAELPDDAARAAYLDRACGADARLRERVEALFRSHDPDGSFLGTPAAVIPGPDHAATRAFEPDPDHAATRTGDGNSSDDEVPLGFLTPSARPDSLGRIGHYEVLQVLGQGGFGIVFRAFDDVLHRVVAVKVLSPQMAATSPARKRFLREARSSAQVRHENVVQVYEVGETPLPYIAMEFIPGETLQQRLNRTGPVEVAEVLRIGRQVAEGLAAAHATDLIHRDIKPGNILLEGGAGRVKITDFGLARAADDASISQSGIIAGTPMYMAPEQALGAKLDQRADLFSLGSVLYQMAAGRPPFRANSTVAVLKRVAEDTPRDIRELVPEVPQWLCDIIAKLHAKNPDERYQSAREVADVLADCEAQLKGGSKLKDFSRIPQRALSKAGFGKRVIVSSFIVLCLVGLVAIVAGLYFNNAEPKPNEMPGPAESQVADDKARLQGRWRMVALEQNGKPVPVGEHIFGYREEFIGDTFVTYAPDGKPWSAPFTLNPGADPKELDLLTKGQGPIRQIYRFDGDKLIFAMGGPGQPRPTGFKTTPDTSFIVATCVRDTGPIPGQTGWVQLFNGKDKTGWKTRPEAPGQWEVNDGILTGTRLPSVLYSDRGDYANFHLRAEIKINQGGDSGVFFRVGFGTPKEEIHAQEWEPESGFEVEILKTSYARKTGSVTAVQPNGPPVILGMTADDSLTRPDEWFTLEIHVEQDRFITKVNGKETANCCGPHGKLSRGHIGLQVWSPNTVVQFRKIEIKELPATASALPPTFKNGLGMEFVIVPKGKSWLGGGKDKLGDKEVEINADFYLGKYEVTQEEWQKVMGENPSYFSRTGEGKDAVKDIPDADLKRFPVEMVSWDQCQLFVAKLNKQEKETGWVYRLPTADE